MPKYSKNDLVFAKVKGYPSWPAIITDVKNKKYQVKFYGTGETGVIKEESLSYYLESKDELSAKFGNTRRKDYLDALNEIEKAFLKTKTDGSDANDSDKDPVKTEKQDIARKLTAKRKSAIESEIPTPKRVPGGKLKTVTAETSTENESIVDEVTEEVPAVNVDPEKSEQEDNSELEVSTDSSLRNRVGRKKPKRFSSDEEVTPKKIKTAKAKSRKSIEVKKSVTADVEDEDEEASVSDVIYSIIPVENIEILVKYFEVLKDKEAPFRKRAPDDLPPQNEKVQVVLAVAPKNATLMGIRYHEKRMPKFHSEFERAAYEAKEASRVIQLKAEIDSGSKSIEEVTDFCVSLEGKNTEMVRYSCWEESLCHKQKKLKFLKIENDLLKCDCGVKSTLGLDKADPEAAIEHLKTMKSLPVEPLMLKKHPQVFEMVKKIQRYVGNVQEWNMEKDEADSFMETAKQVRVEADQVFLKFMKLMLKVLPSRDQINDTIFWTVFMEEVERFQQETSHLKESEVFVMSSEPYSRASILDSLYQEQEIVMGKSFSQLTSTVADSSTTESILGKSMTEPISAVADSSTTEADLRSSTAQE